MSHVDRWGWPAVAGMHALGTEAAKAAIPDVTDAQLEKAYALLRDNLLSARQKHGRKPYVSKHHALGVVEEERKELLDAIHVNDDLQVVRELLDVAGACVWAVASSLDPRRLP